MLVDRENIASHLTPGTVIWRAIVRHHTMGIILANPVFQRSSQDNGGYLARLAMGSNEFYEPILVESNTGLVTILSVPPPEDWIALKLDGISKNGKALFASHLPLPEVDTETYLGFRDSYDQAMGPFLCASSDRKLEVARTQQVNLPATVNRKFVQPVWKNGLLSAFYVANITV